MLPALATLYMSTLPSGEIVFKGRMGQATIKLIANTGPGAMDGEFSLVVVPDEMFGAPVSAPAPAHYVGSPANQAPLPARVQTPPRAPSPPIKAPARPTATAHAPTVVVTAADAHARTNRIIPKMPIKGLGNRPAHSPQKSFFSPVTAAPAKPRVNIGAMPVAPKKVGTAPVWCDLIGDEIPF